MGLKTQPESKCPELLANYCDMLLRKTPLSKKLTSEEIEAKLKEVVRFREATAQNCFCIYGGHHVTLSPTSYLLISFDAQINVHLMHLMVALPHSLCCPWPYLAQSIGFKRLHMGPSFAIMHASSQLPSRFLSAVVSVEVCPEQRRIHALPQSPSDPPAYPGHLSRQ